MKLTLHKSQVHSYSIVSCFDELAVHTCPLFCLQRWVAKVASGLFAVGLYCVTMPRQQTCKGSLYIKVAGVLLHETVERTHLGSKCSETVTW